MGGGGHRCHFVPSLPAAAPRHDEAAVRGQLPALGRAGAALPGPGLHVPPAPRHRRLLLPQGERGTPSTDPGGGGGERGATRFLGWPPLTVIAGAAGEETCALLLQQAAAAAAELRPPAAEAHRPAGTAAPGTGKRGGGRGAGTALGCQSRGGFAVPPIPGLLPHGAAAQLQPHTAPAPPQGTALLQWCRQRWPRLRRWMRRSCTVCGTPQTPQDRVCPAPACGAPYCRPCWREVGSVCLACTPGDPDLSRDSSEDDVGYAA